MVTDATIMQQVQAGDEQQFVVLVRRYHHQLLRFAACKLLDRTAAEDVVQETFLAAFRARDSYSPEFAFSTWLWTILLNLCRSANKRESRHRELHTIFAQTRSAGALEPENSTDLFREESQEQLMRWLSQIPEEEADTLRLRFLGGLKFEDIALAMDCSVSGAKARVKRGLLRLGELAQSRDI